MLRYYTGFDRSTTVAHYFQTPGGNMSISATGARFGNGLRVSGGPDTPAVEPIGANAQTIYAAFAWDTTQIDTRIGIFSVRDAGNYQVSIVVLNSGQIRVTANPTTSTTIGAGSSGVNVIAKTGVVYHIQIKIVVHNTTGSVVVKVNGVEWINVTGINTRNGSANAYANEFALSGGNDFFAGTWDDLHVADDSGATDNTWLGDRRCHTLRPNATGDSAQFTPSAGANWDNLDEASTPDSDTTRNTSSTVGHKDLVNMEALPNTGGIIRAVQALAFAKKDDAGTRDLTVLLKSGTTEMAGTQTPLTTPYAWVKGGIRPINADTSAAFTPTEVNALQAGYTVAA